MNVRHPDGADVAGIIAVLSHVETVGFHGIDMTLAGPVPTNEPDWSGRVRNARIAVAAIGWPEELQQQADTFIEATGRLALALGQGDTESAAVPARDAHAAQHRLSNAAWNYLQKSAGLQGPSATHEHPHHAP